MLLPGRPKSPGLNLYPAPAAGWVRGGGEPLMLDNYTACGTAARTGNLDSVLAINLLALSLIFST